MADPSVEYLLTFYWGRDFFEISSATADGSGEVAAGEKFAAGGRRSIGREPIWLSVKGGTDSSEILPTCVGGSNVTAMMKAKGPSLLKSTTFRNKMCP